MNKLEHKRQGNIILLTIPGVEHVSDEVVNEGDLRFGYAARVSVKHRHHHGEPLSLLFICLQEEGGRRKDSTVTELQKSNTSLGIVVFFLSPIVNMTPLPVT